MDFKVSRDILKRQVSKKWYKIKLYPVLTMVVVNDDNNNDDGDAGYNRWRLMTAMC